MDKPEYHVQVRNGEPHYVVSYCGREWTCDFNEADLRETLAEIVADSE